MMKYLLLLPFLALAACSHHHDSAKPAAGSEAHHGPGHEHHVSHRYNVTHFEGADSNPTEQVGTVTVDSKGVFTVDAADGAKGAKLREAVAKLNSSAKIDDVDRDHASFFDAERAHLRKYYGLTLTPL